MGKQLKELPRDTAREMFEKSVRLYCNIFCRKHKLYTPTWIGERIGTIANFGDYVFDFDSVRYDIDYDVPKGYIIEWLDYNTEKYYSNDKQTISYEYFVTAIKGFYGEIDFI